MVITPKKNGSIRRTVDFQHLNRHCITQGFPRVARCVDDSLLWDDDISNSFWHTIWYIKLCGDNGIVFDLSKFKFVMEEVEFAGFMTNNGYKPTSRLLKAIEAFPTPTNLTSIRSSFVMSCQNLIVAVDHKPLIRIFNDRDLSDIKKPLCRESHHHLRVKQRLHTPTSKNLSRQQQCHIITMTPMPTSISTRSRKPHQLTNNTNDSSAR